MIKVWHLLLKKAFTYLATNYTLMECESGVLDFIINLARGDARYALNIVENAYFASDLRDNKRILTVKIIEEICQQRNTRYSQQEHYDCASAFQKVYAAAILMRRYIILQK